MAWKKFIVKKDFDKRKNLEELEQYAIYLLSQRDYTESGLFDKLVAYAIRESDAQTVVDKMVEMKYVCDARYIENKIRVSSEHPSKGPLRLRQEMVQKGCDPKAVDLELESVDTNTWVENCISLYTRRYKANPKDMKERTKRMRWLVNKGFSFDVAKRAVDIDLEAYIDSFED